MLSSAPKYKLLMGIHKVACIDKIMYSILSKCKLTSREHLKKDEIIEFFLI